MRRGPLLALVCALLVLPVAELVAHARIVGNAVPDRDYAAAAAFVRSEWRDKDAISSAPSWIDPIVRLHLGALISLDMAGRSDDAAYERLWVVRVRGKLPSDAPESKPELARDFGAVTVLRYALGPSPVRFDFARAIAAAHVSLGGRECRWHDDGMPRGGGLGKGVLYPLRQSFQCDPARPWLFVGAVVTEDLDLKPRRCIWQHAAGDDPVTSSWDDVPLADELVFYAGLYYEHERMRQGGPVRADIFIDGERRASFEHHDGDGFRRLRIATKGLGHDGRGQVRVEVRAPEPDRRSFCWSASTRAAGDIRNRTVP